jgi:hypothetical protein
MHNDCFFVCHSVYVFFEHINAHALDMRVPHIILHPRGTNGISVAHVQARVRAPACTDESAYILGPCSFFFFYCMLTSVTSQPDLIVHRVSTCPIHFTTFVVLIRDINFGHFFIHNVDFERYMVVYYHMESSPCK